NSSNSVKKLPENSSKSGEKNYKRKSPNPAKKLEAEPELEKLLENNSKPGEENYQRTDEETNGNLLEAEAKSSWFLTLENNSEESSLTFWSLSLIELPENYQRTAPKRRRTPKKFKAKKLINRFKRKKIPVFKN
ncbi:9048_t:CDS:2, partial [Gigaspora margarita]